MHADERYLKNIRDYLSVRAVSSKEDAIRGNTGLAVLSEFFYCDFLNCLLDCHLVNLNVEKRNTPGIDLIDRDNRIAVQVSTICEPSRIRKKIQSSIDKFHVPENEMWHFYYVPLSTGKPKIDKELVCKERLEFEPQKDILTIARILELAQVKPKNESYIIDKLKRLSELVDQYNQEVKTDTSFGDLLENTYQCMVKFRETLREGNQQGINAAMTQMQQTMQKVFLFSEKHQYVDIENANNAKRIISEYNKFGDKYNRFSAYPLSARMSPEAQSYAQMAEKLFNELLSYVILLLSITRK